MGGKTDTLKGKLFRTLLLSESQRNSLGTLCIEANKLLTSNTLREAPIWVSWLDKLRLDAEQLLDDVSQEKTRLAAAGESRKTSEKWIALMKAQTQPNLATKQKIGRAIGNYKVQTIITFDAQKGRLNRQFDIPKDAPIETLRNLMFGAAIGSEEWQLLRRCRKADCQTYFCDTSGRMPQRDCSPAHGARHRRTKPKGD